MEVPNLCLTGGPLLDHCLNERSLIMYHIWSIGPSSKWRVQNYASQVVYWTIVQTDISQVVNWIYVHLVAKVLKIWQLNLCHLDRKPSLRTILLNRQVKICLQWSVTISSCPNSLQLSAVVLKVCNYIDSQKLSWHLETVLTVCKCPARPWFVP